MARYNKGTVFTNSNCIGCNRCVFSCPVKGANVSILKDGSSHIEVSQKKCISCGSCFTSCTHHAREYNDDLEAFINGLSSGQKISVLVDPTLYISFGDKAEQILGYLKMLGVNNIYDVSFGADISFYNQIKYLKDTMKEAKAPNTFISINCLSALSYIEQCEPDLAQYIIPVQPPVICLMIYLRKKLNITDKLMYLSPCIASKELSTTTNMFLDYSVSFKHLLEHIGQKDISDLSAKSTLTGEYLGTIYSAKGGFIDAIRPYFGYENSFYTYPDLSKDIFSSIKKMCSNTNITHPIIIDAFFCKDGCISSPANSSKANSLTEYSDYYYSTRNKLFDKIYSRNTPEERYEMLAEVFDWIDSNDYVLTFEENFRQPFIIPRDALEDIYNAMYKDTPQKRSINCNSCGYPTCLEMVEAIANGYAKMENCVHYMNDVLNRKYYTDMQTGLPNEKGFYMEYAKLISQNPDKKYVVAVSSINKLHVINNLYGTNVGDKVIDYVAQFYKNFVGEKGICARLEGGHFGICVEYLPEIILKARENQSFDCKHLKVDFPVTLRTGIYVIENTNEDISKIVNYASYTMDKIKNSSKNEYLLYDANIEKELNYDAEITSMMKSALANDEFVLYLQPQYDSTKRLIGAEALSRWIRDDGRMISPGIFIPIFEKNGFIKEMDYHVWENGFKLIRTWMDSDSLPVPISVNISRVSLADDEIINKIKSLQEKYKIDPSLMHFEITESAYMENQDELIQRVGKIREMGFLIAMDDFGSGYSSLNTLKDVPLDILKLDMGFLRGNDSAGKGHSIIEHIINMAHDLDLTTIAEGVETIEQANFLNSLGCDVIQGYLYAKPMPISNYEELLQKSLDNTPPIL